MRLLGEADKPYALLEKCKSVRSDYPDEKIFEINPQSFKVVPTAPFAYWAGSVILETFANFDFFEPSYGTVRVGAQTDDDVRFVRCFWESIISTNDTAIWKPFLKGDSASAYYDDVLMVVNWRDDARELKQFITQVLNGGHWSRHIFNSSIFFTPGISWALRTSSFSPSCVPEGCIPSVSRYLAIAGGIDPISLLAIWNSSVFDAILKLRMERHGHPKFIVGVVKSAPFPRIDPLTSESLRSLCKRAWSLARLRKSVLETSHAFHLPAALRASLGDYDPPSIEAELAAIQAEIDDIAFDLYGFSDADRAAALGSSAAAGDDDIDAGEGSDDSEDDDGANAVDQTGGLLSWAAGVAFGRFDWRLATGERAAPPEPEPFDPLPAKSPGMLPDDAEPFHAHSGILVDDQGHPNDLARLIEEVLARVDAPVPADVRRWLQRDFFPFHLKQYSKSRRKAPIYWPVSTSSGNYTLWLYYPSLTDQTLFTAVNDFIEPKLKQVGQDVAALRVKASARSREDEKNFETLQTIELELIELRDTLLAIAHIYRPQHDDGVQITAAPLWQLFRHKPWQKILKDTWTKLEKGDYDWAHLAMAYWPERVREKCKTEKSLAIAHELEQLYVEPAPKKARGRKKDG